MDKNAHTLQLYSDGIGMILPKASSNLMGSWNHVWEVSGWGGQLWSFVTIAIIWRFEFHILLASSTKDFSCTATPLLVISNGYSQQEVLICTNPEIISDSRCNNVLWVVTVDPYLSSSLRVLVISMWNSFTLLCNSELSALYFCATNEVVDLNCFWLAELALGIE